MVALKNAAIGMIDALGVKGIWRGPDGAENTRVLDTLGAAAAGAYGMRDYMRDGLSSVFAREFGVEPTVTVLSLSDTIIVAAFGHDEPSTVESWGLVDLVCQCSAYVMRRAANGQPPLVYRGAVNFGKMLIWDAFLLGPAVDETSEAYEQADGAFVWLLPAADELEPRPYSPNVWNTMAFKYDVPLKGGRTIRTTVLSPYVDNLDPASRRTIRAGYESAMRNRRVDVTIKRQNTMRFLDHVEKQQQAAVDAIQRR